MSQSTHFSEARKSFHAALLQSVLRVDDAGIASNADKHNKYSVSACFHAQQVAEKYLKGLLAFMEQPIPRTHNLEELQQLCVSLGPALAFTDVDLAELTPYAVQLRDDFEF